MSPPVRSPSFPVPPISPAPELDAGRLHLAVVGPLQRPIQPDAAAICLPMSASRAPWQSRHELVECDERDVMLGTDLDARETRPSRLPADMAKSRGTPVLRNTVASRASKASSSAQETTTGHASSSTNSRRRSPRSPTRDPDRRRLDLGGRFCSLLTPPPPPLPNCHFGRSAASH